MAAPSRQKGEEKRRRLIIEPLVVMLRAGKTGQRDYRRLDYPRHALQTGLLSASISPPRGQMRLLRLSSNKTCTPWQPLSRPSLLACG
jgi:hypothetical protein